MGDRELSSDLVPGSSVWTFFLGAFREVRITLGNNRTIWHFDEIQRQMLRNLGDWMPSSDLCLSFYPPD